MADVTLQDDSTTFAAFSNILDTRILRALSDLGFARPTLIQSKAIPLALEGRDILARARTGSGKTAAYCIPVIQKVLQAKLSASSSDASHRTRALILVPTRELSEQATSHLKSIARYCEKEVVVTNIAGSTPAHLQQILTADQPDVVVATPARALAMLQSKSLSLKLLETLVIDEADLILSYGHDEDVRKILAGDYMPKVCQSFLMSATMTEDVVALKGLVLRRPAILRLEEDKDEAANLTQFFARCSDADKFLLIYVILKLRLIKGKCLIFVNDVNRSYRLKLFLEQFSIRACVLNSELPLNSRYHVVQEFNRGAYEYIIATDESTEIPEETTNDAPEKPKEDADAGEGEALEADDQPESSSGKRKRDPSPQPKPKPSKRRRQKQRESEYGVSRGVDFVDVACVINFDLPTSSTSYTHRVGRTARAGRTGMALSFVSADGDEDDVFTEVEEEQGARGSKLKEYKFDMKQVEAFRYRMSDALRAVTKTAIREARLKELKAELLNSEKLKAHFEDNPLDLDYLRHDQPLNPMRVQPHMKHVPDYLLPRAAQSSSWTEPTDGVGFVPFHQKRGGKAGRGRGRGRGKGGRGGGKKHDPLKKF